MSVNQLVIAIYVLRLEGWSYQDIDIELGLDNGTAFSAYRITKCRYAKAIMDVI